MSYKDATEAAEILVKSWDRVTKIIEEHKRDISIESRELSVRAPENLGELSFALRIRSGFYGGKMTFDVPRISRLVVHSLPAFKRKGSVSTLITSSGFLRITFFARIECR